MASVDEQILRATKEIVVKFIEVGRISPNSFHDAFRDIYKTVNTAVRSAEQNDEQDAPPDGKSSSGS